MSDDEQDVLEDYDLRDYKDATIYFIEVTESMRTCDKKGKSTLRQALRAALSSVTTKIMESSYDIVGVVLFGCIGEDAVSDTRTLIGLERPTALQVRNLKRLIDDDEYYNEICQPKPESPALVKAFELAKILFTEHQLRTFSRRLFLITDNDTAPQQSVKYAEQLARDLRDKAIDIETMFVDPSPSDKFLPEKFYSDVLQDDSLQSFPATSLNLSQVFYVKSLLKRAQFSAPIQLGDIKIGTRGYVLWTSRKPIKARNVYVDENSAKHFVHHERKLLSSVTAKDVSEDTVLVKQYSLGADHVNFTAKQMKEMRTFEKEAVIRIIGFKDASEIADQYPTTRSYFIYPSDNQLTNSTRAFKALYHTLLRKNKVAYCWTVIKAGAAPRFYALYPTKEILEGTEEVVQTIPGGFFLVPIPFMDDRRQLPLRPKALPKLAEMWVDVIVDLNIKHGYDPRNYHNPQNQWFYSVLEAAALEEEVPDESQFRDETLPRAELIRRRVGGKLEEIKMTLKKSEFEESPPPESADSKNRKRKRPVDDDAIKDDALNENAMKYNKAQLIGFLTRGGVNVDDLKSKTDLVRAAHKLAKGELDSST